MNCRLAAASVRLQPHMHTQECVCVFFFFNLSGAERAASPPSGKFSCEAEGPLGTDTEAHFHFETSLSAPFPPHG